MSQEEVFKFLYRLSRDCRFIQVVPISHSLWEETVSYNNIIIYKLYIYILYIILLYETVIYNILPSSV